MRGGQSRAPPSGGVASAIPQRALTAKDIKVIMNDSGTTNREQPEKLARKDSKLGRKDKLQLSEKEAAQMTKSKWTNSSKIVGKGSKILKVNKNNPLPYFIFLSKVSMYLMPRPLSRWTFASARTPWTVSGLRDTVVPCLMTRTLTSCNRRCGESSTALPESYPSWA